MLFASLLLVSPAFAQESSGFGAGDFIGDQIENAIKGAVIGDVPSDDFNLITKDIYAQFLANGYATKKEYSTCKRVANAQAEIGLDNLNQKWWQGGWFNLGYKAIKYSIVIASGAAAAGVNDVIAEEGRGVAADAVLGYIKAEDNEVVEISPASKCNTNIRAVWDKKTMRVYVTITGNCNCADIKPRWSELSHDTLKEFRVDISADVTVKAVEVEEKNPLIFWRERRVKVFLGVKNMAVDTKANCQCRVDDPPPEEPEDGSETEEDDGDGGDDATQEPEDTVVPPEDDGAGDDESTTTGGFLGWLFGGGTDTSEEPEDDTSAGDGTAGEDTGPWQCGAQVAVDGRSGVPTYPYTDENRRDASTQCGGMCAPHQECHVVPESVGAYRNSCTYCKNMCEKGEFTTRDACERAKGTSQECRATGTYTCHALVEQKKKSAQGTVNCEAAIRSLLDTYVGWFDPQLTVTAGSAVFLNGPHRCLTTGEFKQFHVDLVAIGVADASIRAQCPTLAVVSNENIQLGGSGKAATCNTRTEFSF